MVGIPAPVVSTQPIDTSSRTETRPTKVERRSCYGRALVIIRLSRLVQCHPLRMRSRFMRRGSWRWNAMGHFTDGAADVIGEIGAGSIPR